MDGETDADDKCEACEACEAHENSLTSVSVACQALVVRFCPFSQALSACNSIVLSARLRFCCFHQRKKYRKFGFCRIAVHGTVNRNQNLTPYKAHTQNVP